MQLCVRTSLISAALCVICAAVPLIPGLGAIVPDLVGMGGTPVTPPPQRRAPAQNVDGLAAAIQADAIAEAFTFLEKQKKELKEDQTAEKAEFDRVAALLASRNIKEPSPAMRPGRPVLVDYHKAKEFIIYRHENNPALAVNELRKQVSTLKAELSLAEGHFLDTDPEKAALEEFIRATFKNETGAAHREKRRVRTEKVRGEMQGLALARDGILKKLKEARVLFACLRTQSKIDRKLDEWERLELQSRTREKEAKLMEKNAKEKERINKMLEKSALKTGSVEDLEAAIAAAKKKQRMEGAGFQVRDVPDAPERDEEYVPGQSDDDDDEDEVIEQEEDEEEKDERMQ